MHAVESNEQAKARLDRAIELKEFEIRCVEAMAGSWGDASDRAWLLSIFAGTLGTVMAVMSGRESAQWGEIAAQMRRELVELQVERKVLELRGEGQRAH